MAHCRPARAPRHVRSWRKLPLRAQSRALLYGPRHVSSIRLAEQLRQGHTLAHVREVLEINRVTVYRWRQDDPSFAQAYSEAMEAGNDLIEREARRRAVEGYDRPIFQRGALVGLERVSTCC
jgi:hypothetical protein